MLKNGVLIHEHPFLSESISFVLKTWYLRLNNVINGSFKMKMNSVFLRKVSLVQKCSFSFRFRWRVENLRRVQKKTCCAVDVIR